MRRRKGYTGSLDGGLGASFAARISAFGQAGHYDPISLGDMAVRYREEGHQLTVT